ncbi:MAG: LysM peptidoglycan-binding domain-containing protein, partial [Caldilineaceae bacterium]
MKTAQSRRRLRLMVLTSLAILALLLPTVAFAAPVAPAAEAVPSNTGCSTWHTVRYGETLSGIARMYGVSQQAIMSANGITNPSHIYAGTSLCIPWPSSGWDSSGSCSTWHTVAAG